MKTVKTNLDTYDCNLLMSYLYDEIESIKHSNSKQKDKLIKVYQGTYNKVLNIKMQVHNK